MNAKYRQIVGNRIALIGAIVYLLEWAVIVPSGAPDPVALLRDRPASLVEAYSEHVAGTRLLAGWLALVLLGRIAFAAGLRAAFRDQPRQLPLMDVALGAMVVSVALEVGGFGLEGAAAVLADRGADPAAIVALNGAAGFLASLVFIPLGVFVLMSALAMLLSRIFPPWLGWPALVSGVALSVGGVISTSAFGTFRDELDAGVGIGIPIFWIWMLATGVLLFRRAGATESAVPHFSA